MKIRHWDRLGNGRIDFTELGFGTAPLGNLFRTVSEEEAHSVLESGLGGGHPLFRHRAALRPRPVETRSTVSCGQSRATNMCCRPRSAGCSRSASPRSAPASASSSTHPTAARSMIIPMTGDAVDRVLARTAGVDRIDILFVHDVDIFTHGSKEASDRRIDEFMAGGYHALVKLRDQAWSRRSAAASTNAGLPDADRARRFRPVPARRPLHAARTGGAGDLPADGRATRHRHRAGRALQFGHPRPRPVGRRAIQLFQCSRRGDRTGPPDRRGLPAPRRADDRGGAELPAPPQAVVTSFPAASRWPRSRPTARSSAGRSRPGSGPT